MSGFCGSLASENARCTFVGIPAWPEALLVDAPGALLAVAPFLREKLSLGFDMERTVWASTPTPTNSFGITKHINVHHVPGHAAY